MKNKPALKDKADIDLIRESGFGDVDIDAPGMKDKLTKLIKIASRRQRERSAAIADKYIFASGAAIEIRSERDHYSKSCICSSCQFKRARLTK